MLQLSGSKQSKTVQAITIIMQKLCVNMPRLALELTMKVLSIFVLSMVSKIIRRIVEYLIEIYNTIPVPNPLLQMHLNSFGNDRMRSYTAKATV